MDAAVVRQYIDFFQDFLHLCQLETWPQDFTTETELKNAFLIASHVEKCLDKMQTKDLLNEFLATFNSQQQHSKLFLKNFFGDPPKYILKKIINSNTKITQMDLGFKVFLQLFSEEKLEKCLTDLMIEAASKETLLKNLTAEIPKENLLKFKSQLLLSKLTDTDESKETLLGLLQNCNQDTIELLIVSLLNKDFKYHKSVKTIKCVCKKFMSRKFQEDKRFWRYLFKINDIYFTKLCLDHGDIFKIICSALLDCGKLLKENISAEYFYIDLNYSELVLTVQKICENENLKLEFLDLLRENNVDISYWESMVS